MKHKCSKCGHVDEIKLAPQAKGGRSRWDGLSKKERSAEMKRVRKIGAISPLAKDTGHPILGLVEPGADRCFSADDATGVYLTIQKALDAATLKGSNIEQLASDTAKEILTLVKNKLEYDVPPIAQVRVHGLITSALSIAHR